MSIAKFRAYPAPRSKKRPIKNTFDVTLKPDGTHYERGKHGGIDVPPSSPGVVGEPVVAVQEGRVHETGNVWGSAYGKQVLVKHTHKHKDGKRHYWYTFYAHLKTIKAVPGKVVQPGDVIGTLGVTGSTFGAHVHFEMHTSSSWVNGLQNPYSRLEAARDA